MESFKIWVENKKDRERVLKKMSREGIIWITKELAFEGDVSVGCPIGFFVDSGRLLTYSDSIFCFIDKKIKEISVNEYLERDKNQNIIIYRNGNKVIAKNKLTGTTVEVKCHPDDEFDFMTGAKLAFDRLIKIATPQYYNGKVVCINNAGLGFKAGKIYEFIDGRCIDDSNRYFPSIRPPFLSIDELNERCASKFVELVE